MYDDEIFICLVSGISCRKLPPILQILEDCCKASVIWKLQMLFLHSVWEAGVWVVTNGVFGLDNAAIVPSNNLWKLNHCPTLAEKCNMCIEQKLLVAYKMLIFGLGSCSLPLQIANHQVLLLQPYDKILTLRPSDAQFAEEILASHHFLFKSTWLEHELSLMLNHHCFLDIYIAAVCQLSPWVKVAIWNEWYL